MTTVSFDLFLPTERSKWNHEFLVQIASLSRVYVSSSAPQSSLKERRPQEDLSCDQIPGPSLLCWCR